jgi:predicted nucleotide-binding protein
MTLEDAVEHYQSQVPGLRPKFKRTLAALRERFTQEGRLYTPAYVTAIFDAAEDEIRKRNQLAGSSLRRAIDSGLPLREDQAQSALVACFSRLDYRRDSFSDIPEAIIDATDNLGRRDTELENRFSRHVGEIFAQAGKEQIAELKMYLKQREEKAEASKKERIKLTSTAPLRSMEVMKIDDQQLAILEYLEREGDEMPAARMISEKTGIDFGTTCDELTLLESRGLVFCVRLPGHPMRDGRFRLDDGGHALLAERRKTTRAAESENKRALDIATKLIDANFRRDQVALNSKARAVLAECASKGIARSGAMNYAIEKTVSEAIREQADQIVSSIRKVVSESESTLSAKELQELFDKSLERALADGHRIVNDTKRASGIQQTGDHGSGALELVQAEVRERAHAELDLLATTPHGRRKGEGTAGAPLQSLMDQADALKSRRVFIVHGHDEEMKQAVARTLEGLKFTPIVLHEQAGGGRTIIEKFEAYADVGFAVVLLAPDDTLFVAPQPDAKRVQRTRQNVILELGFFIGKLGRSRVAVIFRNTPEFELPSDYAGVEYLHYEDGSWRLGLVRELRAAGYEVDANLLR